MLAKLYVLFLIGGAIVFQGHIEESQAMLRQLLEEQRLRSEHLEEQLNDMMELHQHEITDIKQVTV